MCFASIVMFRKRQGFDVGNSYLKKDLCGLVFLIENSPEGVALFKGMPLPSVMDNTSGLSDIRE